MQNARRAAWRTLLLTRVRAEGVRAARAVGTWPRRGNANDNFSGGLDGCSLFGDVGSQESLSKSVLRDVERQSRWWIV